MPPGTPLYMTWINDARRLWPHVEPLIPQQRERTRAIGGRPRVSDKEVFFRLFWFLRAGCSWSAWPESGPSARTCRRRLREWRDARVFERLLESLGQQAELKDEPVYLDATFIRARGGGESVGLTRHGKGCKLQLYVGADSLPRGFTLAPANQGETKLVASTLAARFAGPAPAALVMDAAYDANWLHEYLAEHGATSWAKRNPTHTGPSSRDEELGGEYRNRWLVERCFAWLAAFRRLATRWERVLANYRSWLCLGIAALYVRRFWP